MTATLPETSFAPDPGQSRSLRDALGRFATGVTVVTTQTPDGPIGMTANSFAAVSLDPALVLWSPARSANRFKYFAAAHHFAIHVLACDQSPIGARFTRGGAGFDGLAHQLNPSGVPLLDATLARFECDTHATHDGGDHLIILGLVRQVTMRPGKPLIFSQGAYGDFTRTS